MRVTANHSALVVGARRQRRELDRGEDSRRIFRRLHEELAVVPVAPRVVLDERPHDLHVAGEDRDVERFQADAAILFSDILVIPHAMGQTVGFVEGTGPRLDPIQSAQNLAALDPGQTLKKLAPVFETVRLVRAELPEDVALIGFSGAPWTVATYMIEGGSTRDFNTVKSWAIRHRQDFSIMLDLLMDSTAMYLKAQIDAGAQALQIFDTWASAVPASDFDDWVINFRCIFHQKVPCSIFNLMAGISAQATKQKAYRFSAPPDQ